MWKEKRCFKLIYCSFSGGGCLSFCFSLSVWGINEEAYWVSCILLKTDLQDGTECVMITVHYQNKAIHRISKW